MNTLFQFFNFSSPTEQPPAPTTTPAGEPESATTPAGTSELSSTPPGHPELVTTPAAVATPAASVPAPEPEIPASTNQYGTISLQFTAQTPDAQQALRECGGIDELVEQMVKPKNMVKMMLKMLLKGSQEKQLAMIDTLKKNSPGAIFSTVQNIEQLRLQRSDIEYTNSAEKPSGSHARLDDLLAELRNQGSRLKSVYTFEWAFKLDLPPGWEDVQYDVSDITSDKSKQALYTLARQQRDVVLQKAIAFRKKHYIFMQRPIVRNENVIDFWQDFSELFDAHIEHVRRYCEFTRTLSHRKLKKLKRKMFEYTDKEATAAFNFSYQSKHN